MPVYEELDTIPPSSSSDRAHCESRQFVHTVPKKIEKSVGGGGFNFYFLGIDSGR
jgi:hypothetical protein